MTNDEYFKKLKELSDEYNKLPHVTQSACPSCGYCPHCGRGGYARPYFVPYLSPYTPYWQPTWISSPTITCGSALQKSSTVQYDSSIPFTYTSQS